MTSRWDVELLKAVGERDRGRRRLANWIAVLTLTLFLAGLFVGVMWGWKP